MNATYDELLEMLRIDREKIEKLEAKAAAERERADALAAHVERLDGLRKRVIEAVTDDSLEILDVSDYRDCAQPDIETSLAQLKAKVSAEALEAEIENGDYGTFARERLKVGVEFYRKCADEIAAGGSHE